MAQPMAAENITIHLSWRPLRASLCAHAPGTHILAAFTFQYPFDGNEFILDLYLMRLQKFLIDGLQGNGVP